MPHSDLEVRTGAPPIELDPATFRALGHELIDRIGDFLADLPGQPVTPGKTPREIRAILGSDPLPEHGSEPGSVLERACRLMFDNSTLIGHPRFGGYITGSPAPLAALADLLAAAVGPNVGGFALAPMATEIEAQAVRWVAELIDYPVDCGGLMVSGGNMANIVGFLAARRAGATWDIRAQGLDGNPGGSLRAYTSAETHTWVHKAADMAGLGTDAIRWIPTDSDLRMDVAALRAAVEEDLRAGLRPFMVVGTAGTVSTGAVDPLPAIAEVCREHGLWFHVDGAYGGFAVVSPDVPADLRGLSEADSVAIDPHKWLYMPAEAGCVLVRDGKRLLDTFSYHPNYYKFDYEDDTPLNYYDYGPQNSRGFRALKVWLALQQAGRSGYEAMISKNIALARELCEAVDASPDLEAWTLGLSITTFRYVPTGVRPGTPDSDEYLDQLNSEIVTRLQHGGELFLSNAIVRGTYLLRTCWVNFRTTSADIQAIPKIVRRVGAETDAELRPGSGVA